jgi:hypothetical protein
VGTGTSSDTAITKHTDRHNAQIENEAAPGGASEFRKSSGWRRDRAECYPVQATSFDFGAVRSFGDDDTLTGLYALKRTALLCAPGYEREQNDASLHYGRRCVPSEPEKFSVRRSTIFPAPVSELPHLVGRPEREDVSAVDSTQQSIVQSAENGCGMGFRLTHRSGGSTEER